MEYFQAYLNTNEVIEPRIYKCPSSHISMFLLTPNKVYYKITKNLFSAKSFTGSYSPRCSVADFHG